MKTAVYIIVFMIVTIGLAATIRFTGLGEKLIKKERGKSSSISSEAPAAIGNLDVEIESKFELPEVLTEISALVYLTPNRFACVQDELGKIFIYNTENAQIEKQIDFAEAGDYEGLAVVGTDAYVLRADGQIFQVTDFEQKGSKTVEHKTHLTAKQNPEGLCFDKENNRLLIAIKDSEKSVSDFKGIYAMDLSNHKTAEAPVYRIDLDEQALAQFKGKKEGSQMQPSAIAVHPKTGDIYITEGSKPKLLILNKDGSFKSVTKLSKEFKQPEGIAFSPDGQAFISNEGGKGKGNILKVKL